MKASTHHGWGEKVKASSRARSGIRMALPPLGSSAGKRKQKRISEGGNHESGEKTKLRSRVVFGGRKPSPPRARGSCETVSKKIGTEGVSF